MPHPTDRLKFRYLVPKLSSNFFNKRAAPDPGMEDIYRGVNVTIMRGSTLATRPMSYSKTCDTFRPRVGQSATTRTGLGRKRLVYFFVDNTGLLALVFEHCLEAVPASVINRLGHLGFNHFAAGYISDNNVTAPPHQGGAEFVLFVPAPVLDLGVNSSNAVLVSGSLSDGQPVLKFAILSRFERGSVRAGCGGFKPEVYTDHVGSPEIMIWRINSNAEVPTSTGILCETPSPELGFRCQSVAVPNAEPVTSKPNLAMLISGYSGLEGHPPERPVDATRLSPPQLNFPMLSARLGINRRRLLNGRAANVFKFMASTGGVSVEIVTGKKSPALRDHPVGEVIAVIPDEVDLSGHLPEQPGVSVLNPNFQRFDHRRILPYQRSHQWQTMKTTRL